MNYLSTMTVRSRLTFGFGVILALMILLTIIGIQKVNFIDRTLAEITDVNSVKQRYAINYRGSVHDRAIAIRDVSAARNLQEVNSFEKTIHELEAFYRESEQKMNDMLNSGVNFSAKERDILRKIDDIQRHTLPLIDEVLAAKKNMEPATDIILDQVRPAFITWLDTINEFIDYQEAQNQTLTPEAIAVAGGFQNLMMILSASSLLISVIVGLLIEKSFRNSLGGEPYVAQSKIKQMAQGDLTERMSNPYKGSILDSLSDMGEKITSIVSNIVGASNSLAVQIEEVSQGSSHVLESATHQANLTQTTAVKLDEMRHSIDQVASIATHTEENSEMTVDFAKEGRKIVNEAAQEMEKISITVNSTVQQIEQLESKTKEIGSIVNVISEISDQTNLLALNAAIEAARAGESGRGFAVVADEVRSLAQRTSDATSQIGTMITEIQTETAASVVAMNTTQPQVESGKAQTESASELLQNIEKQAGDSLEKVKEVALAASNQVLVIGDVSQAMTNISEMSGQSITRMQQNDQATDTLNELVAQLKQEVSYFKV
ncbi:methyl-accepting chemotaxis protein [Vibrio sp. Of7-15]|uniref:methyl-accepting chemotaxis protein n=1 Tax=Vibrio sp. Of7-15 TaxID=2724879 RepID=UPI001EF1D499|nr:methyl-accepting chemotaxis protein [Vibrio sp. Of7-15]MCG7499727.1 methyl-accepting chemotaxis protein [Vibrio sp. Of7-15]